MTVPAGSPAGLLLVTGKHQLLIDHVFGSTPDRGYLALATSGVCPPSDVDRSYFRTPGAAPTAVYEETLLTRRAFPMPAGGGTFTVYLVGQMLSGATASDVEGNDVVHIEFHTT
jgi:hypothetical protein